MFQAELLFCIVGVSSIASAQDAIFPAPALISADTVAESCHEIPSAEAGEPLNGRPPGVRVLFPSPFAEKRLFGLIPNYRAEQAQETYKPIGAREKFKIARSDSFDWPNFILLAGYAAQSQMAAGGFGHSGGMTEFAKFYGRSVGDQIIGSYLTEAIMPSLLHEDPRYFRMGTGSLRRRAAYSATRVFVSRRDNGRWHFNYSEILGNSAVISITSLYYPESQSASEGAERLAMALGNDMISNLLTEFWPDIKRHLPFRKRHVAQN